MKRIALPILIATIIVLTTACGGPTPAATYAVNPDAAATQPPASMDTPSASVGSGTQVTVTLADNTIKASQTTFQAGVKYTFVVTNSGRHVHNFNINPPVSVAGSLDAALSQALLSVPQGQLAVGATVTVDYTFPSTAVGQPLEFSCLIRRHYEDGMHLNITVTQ